MIDGFFIKEQLLKILKRAVEEKDDDLIKFAEWAIKTEIWHTNLHVTSNTPGLLR